MKNAPPFIKRIRLSPPPFASDLFFPSAAPPNSPNFTVSLRGTMVGRTPENEASNIVVQANANPPHVPLPDEIPGDVIWSCFVGWMVVLCVQNIRLLFLSAYRSVNTTDRLQKIFRGSYFNPSICLLCRMSFESIDHLLIHCCCVSFLRNKIYQALGVLSAPPATIQSLCEDLLAFKASSQRQILLRNISIASLWIVWNERNNRIFQDKVRSGIQLWEDVISLAALWTTKSKAFSDYSASIIALNWESFL